MKLAKYFIDKTETFTDKKVYYALQQLPITIKMVDKMIEKGLSIEDALCYIQNKKTIRYLIDKGAKLDTEIENKVVPYWFDMGSIKYAISKGFDFRKKNSNGDTIFHKRYLKYSHLEYIISIGFDLNTVNNKGETIIHTCYNKLSVKMINLLRENGFILEKKDNYGNDIFDL